MLGNYFSHHNKYLQLHIPNYACKYRIKQSTMTMLTLHTDIGLHSTSQNVLNNNEP